MHVWVVKKNTHKKEKEGKIKGKLKIKKIKI